MSTKYVYTFGGKVAEGKAEMKELLGGKGANLAEMCQLGLPVPAGLTITTECCTAYYANNCQLPSTLMNEVWEAMKNVEQMMGLKYDDADNPLLISCRSGARSSMPGMMDTVLNIGLCSKTIQGLVNKTNNPRFVYDSYRRLIMMYADVVMEKAEGFDPAEGKGIRRILDEMLDAYKSQKGYKSDADLTADDLMKLSNAFKAKVKEVLKADFPDNARAQLEGGIKAVFKSWNGKKAISYRRIEGIPDDWGTAVNVQAMVFGNMGESSATGVAFTRNPATGDNRFYGEWLVNAQGEDVVAGIRTPNPLNDDTKNEQNKHLLSLQEKMPVIYEELYGIRQILEKKFCDMLDVEFTIQEGKLYMLQCRVGKRTGIAAVKMALDMLKEGMIDERTAVCRVSGKQLEEFLHPILDHNNEKLHQVVAKGLPAGPGGSIGEIVLTCEDALKIQKENEQAVSDNRNIVKEEDKKPVRGIILVREETNPEDVEGMKAASGILTARGGMTSHAALVARGWGKCCIVGCSTLHIDMGKRTVTIGNNIYREGDTLSLNGIEGLIYASKVKMVNASESPLFEEFMSLAEKFRKMGVRTNADNPKDTQKALEFGAEGIGLFRIEHMFYGEHSEEPLRILRNMILSKDDEKARKVYLNELKPHIFHSVKATMNVMDGKPVTFRLIDPPLHEFAPKEEKDFEVAAEQLQITVEQVRKKVKEIEEVNPMMGLRGVRLGIMYPEITEVQYEALFEAAAELLKAGKNPKLEIMVPLTSTLKELAHQKEICDRIHDKTEKAFEIKIEYLFGTMIEIPRAAITADEIATVADFFSFGTNDLTQMTFGFSRDDVNAIIGKYIEEGILKKDPFQTIDFEGVGSLVKTGVGKGRSQKENLKTGVCGEHGGDPDSVEFFYKTGMNYVSCSPFRVPVARLAAAQAAINESK
jgi:pyruvate,orthophosphate dikinase